MRKTFAVRQLLCPVVSAVVPTLLLSGFASAEMLGPGDLTADLSANLSSRPDFGGHLEAQQFIPFSLSDNQGGVFYQGQIEHDVVRDTKSNTLSFYYRFINTPSSAIVGFEHLTASQFNGYTTEVAVLTDRGGDTAPTDVFRTDDGADMIFAFDETAPRLAPNANSLTFLVKTNAWQFDEKGTANIRAFTAPDLEGDGHFLAEGDTTISTFRPIGTVVPSAPPPPVNVTVPLPPPVWTALPTLLGSMVYIRRFRVRQGHG